MSKYRTAMGRTVDMGAMATRNEKVRAVGNMKSNARGDLLDAQNRIIQDASSRVAEAYNKTVVDAPKPVVKSPPIIRDQINLSELNDFDDE
jgi:hypothetical protein